MHSADSTRTAVLFEWSKAIDLTTLKGLNVFAIFGVIWTQNCGLFFAFALLAMRSTQLQEGIDCLTC